MNWTVLDWNLSREKNSLFCKMSRQVLRPTQPPIQWAPEFFPRNEWLKHDTDHSPPSTDEVKNKWSYTSASPIHCHGTTPFRK